MVGVHHLLQNGTVLPYFIDINLLSSRVGCDVHLPNGSHYTVISGSGEKEASIEDFGVWTSDLRLCSD